MHAEAHTHALVRMFFIHTTQAAGMLTMDGRCKTLDSAADGYVRAEGVGLLQIEQMGLRPTSSARQPLGVLAGTAVNQVSLPHHFTDACIIIICANMLATGAKTAAKISGSDEVLRIRMPPVFLCSIAEAKWDSKCVLHAGVCTYASMVLPLFSF